MKRILPLIVAAFTSTNVACGDASTESEDDTVNGQVAAAVQPSNTTDISPGPVDDQSLVATDIAETMMTDEAPTDSPTLLQPANDGTDAESSSESGELEDSNGDQALDEGTNDADIPSDSDPLPADAVKHGDAELFGAPLSKDVEFVDFDALLAQPHEYADRLIQTEGIVRQNCNRRGCWMEMRSLRSTTSENVRVRFLDYGFFVPLDSRGTVVRVEGTAALQTLSVEEVEHLVAEGYDPGIVDEDGTATLVSFTATGVEMWNRNLD